MADLGKLPYEPQNVQEVQDLISNLIHGSSKDSGKGKKTFSCKRTQFDVQNSPEKLTVTSWRFQDWDYKRDDLPTYARGLFTAKNEKGQSEITIRGYDKFFNIDEVNATKWRNIENNTKGPYELSLKENGCIIFISGLHDGTLLVCSKHSTGARIDTDLSHAEAGERWVDRHLASVGKTRAELAQELRKRNATAVAELCDDEFEEHILAYGKDAAGLYLHGININLPEFMTYSGPQVHAFANEWGFRKTDFLVIEEVQEMETFLERVAETGTYNGRDVEGFVIRCKARSSSSNKYTDWFFKYKFEEPYLMYRQWRECTKALISGKPPRYKKHVQITEEYLLFARRKLAENSKMAREYAANHGIIKLRDDFLKEKNLKGSDIIRQEYALTGGAPGETRKDVILVPIATLGCGKTTIAIALQHLFNWGVVQNDNIVGKGRPPRFTKEVLFQLESAPVVFADRNNAQKHERDQIINDVHKTHLHARLVALNFVHSPEAIDRIRKVTQDRVFSRGDNHQTIQAASDQTKVIGIMEGFIHRYEPLNPNAPPDDGFDAVIDLDPTLESRQNLETVISSLHTIYPKLFTDMPSSDDLDDAIKLALRDYKPDIRHTIPDRGAGPKNQHSKHQKHQKPQPIQNAKKKKPLEYVSVTLPKNDILNALETAFGSVSSNKGRFFKQLQQTRRVQPEFHVTLIHRASASSHPELWTKYSEIHEQAGSAENKLGDCKVQLERVVWDDRIMAIVARLVDEDWECTNAIAHVTIGTRGPDVKPKESNDLLHKWVNEGAGDVTGIGEVAIEGRPVVNGWVKGNLSR
ncbi:RNA ligase-domain-containing protein [Bisporella sp. PMI_857]|nr:RNA ligase-domain-containing protein [Bisporella sp. PMI_857]